MSGDRQDKNPAMKIFDNKELKIGIFVILVLAATFLVINYLRNKDIFNREYEVSAVYEDVHGLLPSASVMFKGYKVGQVNEVEYDNASGLFTVTCAVSKEYTIPEDSELIIISTDIMGGKGVRILPGMSETAAQDGSRLAGGSEADMIASLAGSVTSLAEKLENTLDSLGTVISNINAMTGEENRKAVSAILLRMENTAANVEALSDALGSRAGEFSSFAENLNSLAGHLDSTLNVAGEAVSDIAGITAAIDPDEVAAMLVSFRALLDKIQDPDGSLGLLMKDSSVYDSLDTLLDDVDSLVRKIEANPKKYLRISVF